MEISANRRGTHIGDSATATANQFVAQHASQTMSNDGEKRFPKTAHASEIRYPGMHDVMLGRGGEANSHSGNTIFRQFVKQFKEEYQATPRQKKPQMALKVVRHWRNLDPPGRFLTRTHPDAATSTWHEVGNELATKRAMKNLGERDSKQKQRELAAAKVSWQPSMSAEAGLKPKALSVTSSNSSVDAAPSGTRFAISNDSDAGSSQDLLNLVSFRAEPSPLIDSFQTADLKATSASSSQVEASSQRAVPLQSMACAPSSQLSSASTQPPAGLPLEEYWPLSFQASLQMPLNRQQQQQQQQQQQHLPRKAEDEFQQKLPPRLYNQHHPQEKKTSGTIEVKQQQQLPQNTEDEFQQKPPPRLYNHHHQQQQQQQLPQYMEDEFQQKLPPTLYNQDHPQEKKTSGADLPTAAALTATVFSSSSDHETGSKGGDGSNQSSPENMASIKTSFFDITKN